jgi:hypothetical protein
MKGNRTVAVEKGRPVFTDQNNFFVDECGIDVPLNSIRAPVRNVASTAVSLLRVHWNPKVVPTIRQST